MKGNAKQNSGVSSKKMQAMKIAFFLYCIWMFWLLFGQRIGWDVSGAYLEQLRKNLNLEPMKTIIWFMTLPDKTSNSYLIRHAAINLIGNVVLFLPFGIVPPCLWQKFRHFWRLLLVAMCAIILVELTQLVTLLGSCDVDDLILNITGVIIGYGIWKGIDIYCRKRKKMT